MDTVSTRMYNFNVLTQPEHAQVTERLNIDAQFFRKERAVGMVPREGCHPTTEDLDEVVRPRLRLFRTHAATGSFQERAPSVGYLPVSPQSSVVQEVLDMPLVPFTGQLVYDRIALLCRVAQQTYDYVCVV